MVYETIVTAISQSSEFDRVTVNAVVQLNVLYFDL